MGASVAQAMSDADMQALEKALEEGGFTDFRPVRGGRVFQGMSALGRPR
jgi:hypothetical protein